MKARGLARNIESGVRKCLIANRNDMKLKRALARRAEIIAKMQ